MSDPVHAVIVGEAAVGERLGVSKWDAARVLRQGRLRSSYQDGAIAVTEADVVRFLEAPTSAGKWSSIEDYED
jgi:hypothetical protein